jgi:hypothetical protein
MLPDATLQREFKAKTDLENHSSEFAIKLNVLLMQILVKKMDAQSDGLDPRQHNSLKKIYPYDISIRVLSSKIYIEI